MPHRLALILGMFSSVDWKALVLFMSAAVAMPGNGMPMWIEGLVRIALPIIGGIIWVFLKPRVIKWRNKLRK